MNRTQTMRMSRTERTRERKVTSQSLLESAAKDQMRHLYLLPEEETILIRLKPPSSPSKRELVKEKYL